MATSLSGAEIDRYRREGHLAPLFGVTAAEAGAVWRAVGAFGRRHRLREAHVLRNKAHLKMPSLTPLVTDERVLDLVEAILGPGSGANRSAPRRAGYVDAPFGGGTPVSARNARPAHDFYRKQPAA